MLLRRLWQIHDRGSLSSSGGHGSYMKGCAPGGGNQPCFVIIILRPVSYGGGTWKLTGVAEG
jgi:hypothetical protein